MIAGFFMDAKGELLYPLHRWLAGMSLDSRFDAVTGMKKDPKQPLPSEILTVSTNEQSKRNQMNYPEFQNKVILLYLHNRPDDHNVVLQDASMESQAGRMFIVGEFAEGTTANDWATGVRTAVAWDCVEQYLIFDTIENYFERISMGWESKTVQ
jgi:hypothetical protein